MRETDKEFVLNLLRGIAARNGAEYKERVLRGIKQIEDDAKAAEEGEAWRATAQAREPELAELKSQRDALLAAVAPQEGE